MDVTAPSRSPRRYCSPACRRRGFPSFPANDGTESNSGMQSGGATLFGRSLPKPGHPWAHRNHPQLIRVPGRALWLCYGSLSRQCVAVGVPRILRTGEERCVGPGDRPKRRTAMLWTTHVTAVHADPKSRRVGLSAAEGSAWTTCGRTARGGFTRVMNGTIPQDRVSGGNGAETLRASTRTHAFGHRVNPQTMDRSVFPFLQRLAPP
jgi:hypothetical protein